MAYRVEVSHAADGEAEEAYQWIAKKAPRAAANWYLGLLKAIHSLAEARAKGVAKGR